MFLRLVLSAILLASASNAFAYGHWHGDIHTFHHHDIGRWRGGRWHHGWHDGHIGWWWVAAGAWYFYTRPVYPYPDPYVPSTVVVQVPTPAPAPVAPATPPPVSPSPQAQNYYRCADPDGFYPYVAQCPGGWSMVPVTPPK